MTTVAKTAERSSRFIALPVLNLSAGRRWVFNVTPRPLYAGEAAPIPIAQDAGWTSLPVWTGKERRKSLSPHRGSKPDSPARSDYVTLAPR